jgi:hypothetical protein
VKRLFWQHSKAPVCQCGTVFPKKESGWWLLYERVDQANGEKDGG